MSKLIITIEIDIDAKLKQLSEQQWAPWGDTEDRHIQLYNLDDLEKQLEQHVEAELAKRGLSKEVYLNGDSQQWLTQWRKVEGAK